MTMNKLIWERKDNFYTFRQKAMACVGKEVVSHNDSVLAYKILMVSEIEISFLEDHMRSFAQFLDGDMRHSTARGDFNFNHPVRIPIWKYFIRFGTETSDGMRITRDFMFHINRKHNDLEEDLKDGGSYLVFSEHPFFFYEHDNKITTNQE